MACFSSGQILYLITTFSRWTVSYNFSRTRKWKKQPPSSRFLHIHLVIIQAILFTNNISCPLHPKDTDVTVSGPGLEVIKRAKLQSFATFISWHHHCQILVYSTTTLQILRAQWNSFISSTYVWEKIDYNFHPLCTRPPQKSIQPGD